MRVRVHVRPVGDGFVVAAQSTRRLQDDRRGIFALVVVYALLAFGVATAASVGKIDHFNYIQSALLTPLFLVSGTFFPIDQLPEGLQVAANVNPKLLYGRLVPLESTLDNGDVVEVFTSKAPSAGPSLGCGAVRSRRLRGPCPGRSRSAPARARSPGGGG